jgi:hypothetical protein
MRLRRTSFSDRAAAAAGKRNQSLLEALEIRIADFKRFVLLPLLLLLFGKKSTFAASVRSLKITFANSEMCTIWWGF